MDYIDTRRIGRATVTAISEGTARWAPRFQAPEAAWRAAVPEADAAGRITIGLTTILIRLDDALILIDPGFDDPEVGGYVSPNLEEVARSPGLTAALAALGVAPEEITHVVVTHTHPDHCWGVAVEQDGVPATRFPRARHIIGRADWERVDSQAPAGSPVAERLRLIERLGLLDVVAGEHEIVPGAVLLPTPGETPGHVVLRIKTDGERFYALGDLFHHGCEVAHLDWVPAGRDPVITRASRERVLAEAAPSQALLAFTHERFPPWGRVIAEGERYRWRRV